MTDMTEAKPRLEQSQDIDDALEEIKKLKKKLNEYTFSQRAKASLETTGEDIGEAIQTARKKAGEISDELGTRRENLTASIRSGLKENNKVRIGVFVFWLIITIVFLVLFGLIYNRTTQDSPALGLLVTVILLHIINMIAVGLNKVVTSFVVSIISFIIGMAFLLRQEKDLYQKDANGNTIDCLNNKSTYQIYMAAHTFNVVLFFFSLMRFLS